MSGWTVGSSEYMVGDESRSGWLVADGGKQCAMFGFQLEKNSYRVLRKLARCFKKAKVQA